jgi:hypothetical protein
MKKLDALMQDTTKVGERIKKKLAVLKEKVRARWRSHRGCV